MLLKNKIKGDNIMVLINGFFKTIQNDFNRVFTPPSTDDAKMKVALAAGRIFSAIIMGFATVMAAKAFVALSPIALMFAAALYIAGHDVFVMCQNHEKGLFGQLGLLAQAVIGTIQDLAGGEGEEFIPRRPSTTGTIAAPVWNYLLQKCNPILVG